MKKLSDKNKFKLETYRDLELRNFCRQYHVWKAAYESFDSLSYRPTDLEIFRKSQKSPVEKCAEMRAELKSKMNMVESTLRETLSDVMINPNERYKFMFEGITRGTSYDVLAARVPVSPFPSRQEYYYYYRKFFYLLDKCRS